MKMTDAHRHSPSRRAQLAVILLAALVWFILALPPASAQTYTVLHYFNGTDGSSPQAALIQDAAGTLYGTALYGGNPACYSGCGTIFKLDPSGKFTTLYSFQGTADGYEPYESLVRDAAGNLYGATTYGGKGRCANGTSACGTVYKLDPNGRLSVLHSFNGTPDGATPPPGRLVTDGHGNLYGTTAYGGAFGFGAVYELTRSGKETILYNFASIPDGNMPMAGMVLDPASHALFGATEFGDGCPYGSIFGFGCGTVYQLTASGETQLYNFSGERDGASPNQNLIMDSAGNLYGTSEEGGDVNCPLAGIAPPASAALRQSPPPMPQNPPGCGTVFQIEARTGQETVLYSFTGGGNGYFPASGVILDSAGNLYGATTGGGDNHCNPNYGGCGVIFKLDHNRNFTVLHTFTGPEGAEPEWGSLLLDSAGNLYGTTGAGGKNNNGVIFKITP